MRHAPWIVVASLALCCSNAASQRAPSEVVDGSVTTPSDAASPTEVGPARDGMTDSPASSDGSTPTKGDASLPVDASSAVDASSDVVDAATTGRAVSYFDFSAGDMRGYAGDGDFSPQHWKGECRAGQVMTGLSVDTSCASPHVMQCESGRSWSAPSATVHPNCGDARRDTSTGDWDSGHFKGECGASEAVVGISRAADGAVHDLLCAQADVPSAGACTARNVNGGENRGRTLTGDWSLGQWKTECAPGQYVKGVSLEPDLRHPHAILCCSGAGPAGVTNATTPERATAATCNTSGPDTSVTVFDQAHLTGSSRYVYKTVTFPDQGTPAP